MNKHIEMLTDKLQHQRDELMASTIIRDLQKAGFTPDDMIRIIRMAREKFKTMKQKDKSTK
jgi:hypothetical protein